MKRFYRSSDENVVESWPKDYDRILNGESATMLAMDAAALVAFFEAKGKFKPSGAGFTMDREKVCKDY